MAFAHLSPRGPLVQHTPLQGTVEYTKAVDKSGQWFLLKNGVPACCLSYLEAEMVTHVSHLRSLPGLV